MFLFRKKVAPDEHANENIVKDEENTLPQSIQEMTPDQKARYKKIKWIDRLLCVAAFLLIASIFAFNFLIAIVPSGSMYPTLAVREFVLVNRCSNDELNRGDIVVFQHKNGGKETFFCKRMIGLPGDTIEIKNNILYLNGEPQYETYCAENMLTADLPLFTLNENEYFVMGDNRNYSFDSRAFGPIQGDTIVGRSIYHAQFFNDPELDIFYQNQPMNANPLFIDPKPDHDKVIKH